MTTSTLNYVTVARVGDIPPGQAIVFDVGDKPIVIAHVEGDDFYAIDDECTHDGGPLGDCDLDGAVIECPRHGATFDVRDGEALTLPAIMPVQCYAVRVVGDEIQVAV